MAFAGFTFAGFTFAGTPPMPGSGAGAPARAIEITGAGSTFAAPLYAAWAALAAHHGIILNYQGIGSGAGINQIRQRTVDFGATDAPLNAAQLTREGLVQAPVALGAVVVVANLPGIGPDRLRLTGPLLADIWLGRITHWRDPRIVALNPGLALPALPIAPVYRADGSGTTWTFTRYLARVSAGWAERVGTAASVRWLAGNGARGNDGMAALVGQLKGALGYLDAAYVTTDIAGGRLAPALLENRDGQFVPAQPANVAAAAAILARPAPVGQGEGAPPDLIDQAGPESWPIVATTFVLLPAAPATPAERARNAAVRAFFALGLTEGDAAARALHYVPLPEAVRRAVLARWAEHFGANQSGADR